MHEEKRHNLTYLDYIPPPFCFFLVLGALRHGNRCDKICVDLSSRFLASLAPTNANRSLLGSRCFVGEDVHMVSFAICCIAISKVAGKETFLLT